MHTDHHVVAYTQNPRLRLVGKAECSDHCGWMPVMGLQESHRGRRRCPNSASIQINLGRRPRGGAGLTPEPLCLAPLFINAMSVSSDGISLQSRQLLRINRGSCAISSCRAFHSAARAIETREVGLIVPDAKDLAASISLGSSIRPTGRARNVETPITVVDECHKLLEAHD